MKITTVLFDLDGTLLPMDQEKFIRAYFGQLAAHMAPYGYEKEKLLKTIWSSTDNMIHNKTGRPNEEVFWECMEKAYGLQIRQDEPKFDQFYQVGFPKVREACGYTPMAAEVIAACKEKNLQIATSHIGIGIDCTQLQKACLIFEHQLIGLGIESKRSARSTLTKG